MLWISASRESMPHGCNSKVRAESGISALAFDCLQFLDFLYVVTNGRVCAGDRIYEMTRMADKVLLCTLAPSCEWVRSLQCAALGFSAALF